MSVKVTRYSESFKSSLASSWPMKPAAPVMRICMIENNRLLAEQELATQWVYERMGASLRIRSKSEAIRRSPSAPDLGRLVAFTVDLLHECRRSITGASQGARLDHAHYYIRQPVMK